MPDIKFGRMDDEMAADGDFENETGPEPQPEPEPKARPVRVKLLKEEKMAKMKALAKAHDGSTRPTCRGIGATATLGGRSGGRAAAWG